MFSVIAIPVFAEGMDVLSDYDFVERSTGDELCLEGFVIPANDGTFGEDWLFNESDGVIELFSLPGNATRAEAIHLLVQAVFPFAFTSSNTPDIRGRFSDVSPQHWFYPAVAWASDRQWVTGFTDGTFRPNQTITRQEFVTMMVRAKGAGAGTINLTFTDRNQIADWALPHVRRAVQNGWIAGFPDNTFRPTAAFSRDHALTFARRINGGVSFPNNIRTITWNAHGGSTPVNWQRVSGNVIGRPLPTSTWTDRTFRMWSSTNDTTTRGARLSENDRMPNGNIVRYARWRNPVNRHNPQWYSTTALTVRNPNFLSVAWRNGVAGGVSNWQIQSTPVNFVMNSNSNNLVSSLNWGITGSWGRIWYREVTGIFLTRFDIELNSGRLVSSNPDVTNLTNTIMSVMAHELGHAVGLRDNPTLPTNVAVTNTIMNTHRDRNELIMPTTFDVQSVNWLY